MFTCNVITNLPENMHCNSAVCPRKALVFSEYTPRGSILLCEESVKVKQTMSVRIVMFHVDMSCCLYLNLMLRVAKVSSINMVSIISKIIGKVNSRGILHLNAEIFN